MGLSNHFQKQAYVNVDEHGDFLDFHVMKLPKYDAILGKSQLDRWNSDVDWRTNTVTIKVGKRLLVLNGVPSSTFSDVSTTSYHCPIYRSNFFY